MPQQVPEALTTAPVLRFSVIVGLPEIGKSFVCAHRLHTQHLVVTQQRNSLDLPPHPGLCNLLPWLSVTVSRAWRGYVCAEFCSSLWH